MGMLMDLLSGVGNVLDTPGRFTRTAMVGRNPFSSVFDPSQGASGRDVLEHYGMAGPNQEGLDAGDVGGFLAEMILDPTNLIGSGLLAKLPGKASRAKAANRGIEAANQLSLKQRLQGFMPEEVAKLTKIVDETGKPKVMYHGTPHVFDRPDSSKWDKNALYGPGHYTTDSGVVAGGDTGYASKKSAIYEPARLKFPPSEVRSDLKSVYATTPDEFLENAAALGDGTLKTADETRRYLIDSLEKMPDSALPLESGVISAIGLDPEQWISPARYLERQPNVRMQFIDARNPLDIDASSRVTPQLANLLRRDARDQVRAAIQDARENQRLMNFYGNATPAELAVKSRVDSYGVFPGAHGGVGVPDWARDVTPRELRIAEKTRLRRYNEAAHLSEEAMDAVRGMFANRNNVPEKMLGQDIYDLLKNEPQGVRAGGYDAITHIGGRRSGGPSHNVAIALYPSQIYLPYIAKELQQLQRVPSARPTLAALLGQNALARFAGSRSYSPGVENR